MWACTQRAKEELRICKKGVGWVREWVSGEKARVENGERGQR